MTVAAGPLMSHRAGDDVVTTSGAAVDTQGRCCVQLVAAVFLEAAHDRVTFQRFDLSEYSRLTARAAGMRFGYR
jgi:hypothetical protein